MWENQVYEVTVIKLFIIIPYIKKIYVNAENINKAIREGEKLGLVHGVKLHSCLFNGEMRYFNR